MKTAQILQAFNGRWLDESFKRCDLIVDTYSSADLDLYTKGMLRDN